MTDLVSCFDPIQAEKLGFLQCSICKKWGDSFYREGKTLFCPICIDLLAVISEKKIQQGFNSLAFLTAQLRRKISMLSLSHTERDALYKDLRGFRKLFDKLSKAINQASGMRFK